MTFISLDLGFNVVFNTMFSTALNLYNLAMDCNASYMIKGKELSNLGSLKIGIRAPRIGSYMLDFALGFAKLVF